MYLMKVIPETRDAH